MISTLAVALGTQRGGTDGRMGTASNFSSHVATDQCQFSFRRVILVVPAAVWTENVVAVGQKASSEQQRTTLVADEAVGVPLTPLERYELGTVHAYTQQQQPDTPQRRRRLSDRDVNVQMRSWTV